MQFELKNNSDFGVALVTENPITKHYYVGTQERWTDWVKENTTTLLKKHKNQIKQYGLCILLKVFSTKSAEITILDKSQKDTQIGFTAEVASIGKLNPHGGWHAENSRGAWFKFTGKVFRLSSRSKRLWN